MVVANGSDLSFDLTLRVRKDDGGQPRFLGPFAQGPPTGRFVYVNSGTYAGQKETAWARRAKVHLKGVTWALVEKVSASPTAVLQARIAGTGRDGGPACGTVPLLGGRWAVHADGGRTGNGSRSRGQG